jgi:hypothetical protein
MPDAQCVRSLVCSVLVVAHECSHHGHTEIIRHSPRDGFTAYFVLSPVSEFWFVTVVGGIPPRKLGTSNGCQDHTTWPYASAFSSGAMR